MPPQPMSPIPGRSFGEGVAGASAAQQLALDEPNGQAGHRGERRDAADKCAAGDLELLGVEAAGGCLG
jgi:hypothetical protein